MATFSIVSSNSAEAVTPAFGLSSIAVGTGNILLAVISSNELGTSPASHSMGPGTGVWTRILDSSFQIGSFNTTNSVWWRPVQPGDSSPLLLGSVVSGGTIPHRLTVLQIAPSTSYDSRFIESVSNAALATIDNVSSGDTSFITDSSGENLLVVGVAGGSLGNETSNPVFTPAKDNFRQDAGEIGGLLTLIGFDDSDLPGIKSVTVSDPTGGITGFVGVVVFRNADTHTGTGAINLASTEVSGTGSVEVVVAAAGAIDFAPVDISGTVVKLVIGDGDVNFSSTEVVGTVSRASVGAGVVNFSSTETVGTGFRISTGAGVVNFSSTEAAGTGSRTSVGAGDINLFSVETVGVGSRAATGTGIISFPPVEASGIVTRLVIGSGSINFSSTEAVGTGSRISIGSGVVNLLPVEASGIGFRTSIGDGDVDFSPTEVVGTGFRTSVGDGDVNFSPVEVFGTSAVTSIGTGVIDFAPVEASGFAVRLFVGSGSINFVPTAVTGQGLLFRQGTGEINTTPVEANGIGSILEQVLGTGTVTFEPVQVGGAGVIETPSIGTIITRATQADGVGQRSSVGAGNIVTSVTTVLGLSAPVIAKLPPRGAGRSKQLKFTASTQRRVMGPQQLRERARKQEERRLYLEELQAQQAAMKQRIVNDAIAMLLLS